MARTYVDRGGTFTDLLIVEDDGTVEIRKVPSDRAVVGALARGALTFGTTVATNALLERAGVRCLLVVTTGFADLVRIGDFTRPHLFDPEAVWPEPLCAAVVEVPGRFDLEGHELAALTIPDTLLERVADPSVEAVAVVLIHGSRHPAHELAVGAAIAAVRPDVHVALGHRVSPEVGYLGRIETTLVDAAISPRLSAALARDRIDADALAMRSDGSLCPGPTLRAPDAVLSGPAGGVVAVAAVARQGGFARAVGLDMGGTSTDVCRVDGDQLPRREGEVRVAGVRLRRPMLEVDTIAAGGGSILWADGLRYGVGPASAGADPGPQCYGRGGPPTLTDAALALGLVDPGAFSPPLELDQVDLPGPPEAFLDIAREQMAAAIERLATARGVSLDDHALVAFGGAAGQHAAHVAERLGIDTVLFHPCAGVLCAYGQALATREEADVRPLWAPLPDGWDRLEAAWALMRSELPDWPAVSCSAELRHRGTDHALEVSGDTLEALLAAFQAAHHQRYGFDRDLPVEVVNARVRVRAAPPEVPAIDADPWGLGDDVCEGPTVITATTTAVAVPAGWIARRVDGLLRLTRQARAPRRVDHAAPGPRDLTLWGSRFMAVAEQAGEVLRRLARSVNIRERLDFSCAVFDGEGHLVANAPHIPVHLGAMGVTVRDLLRHHPAPEPGQSWLTNDPAAGGSHLPDLTVITVVHHTGQRFFVASRGHHVDVGGLTPGSMPPHSTTLADEGLVFRHLPLLEGGRLRALDTVLAGCRDPDTVRADLEAQLAANRHAARQLMALGPATTLAAWMAHLQDLAEAAVAQVIAELPAVSAVVEDRLDDLTLRLQLRREGGRLVVDLTGTGGPHSGNLNAPPAVVRAAVLYALRVLVPREIPLNEGALRAVHLVLPTPSVVNPPPGAAVAGGNVETSQRIVDLVLRAAGRMAASAGTMSNLTFGGDDWSAYETLGAGQGASAAGPGPSARQIHMTNTRATDPEVLEARLPLRLHRVALRPGSGGDGTHRGGDGLVREIEVLRSARAALLATRRRWGAPGLGTAATAAPGIDEVRIAGTWRRWSGDEVDLAAGDRVRVSTPGGGGWSPPGN